MAGQIKSNEDAKKLGTILFVAAHPDDETFTAGGLLATAVRNGQKVIRITATRGEAGVQDESSWPAERLGQIREEELRKSLKITGITNHYWLNYHDGKCAMADKQEAVDMIVKIINEFNGDSVLTFGPDGLTGHPDHQTVYSWVKLALNESNSRPIIYISVELDTKYEEVMKKLDEEINLYFNIDKPPLRKREECDICFGLDEETKEIKRNALAAMPSQMENVLAILGDSYKEAFACETFVISN